MRGPFLDLIEFEKACGHELSTQKPKVDDLRTANLRSDLITEEYKETEEALDRIIEAKCSGNPVTNEMFSELSDGLADLIYVCIGTAVRFGIDLPEVWRRVHESNMAKFGPGSSVREDGKRMKPPGWVKPDIIGVIENQKPLCDLYGVGNSFTTDTFCVIADEWMFEHKYDNLE